MGRPKFTLFNCSGTVRNLNKAPKPSPTNVKGSETAMKNHLRRRLAPIRKAYVDKDGKKWKQKYGPLFGIKKIPINKCQDGTTVAKGSLGYAAHTGTNEDVVYFKSLYGGTRSLGNGCDDDMTNCEACKPQKFVNGKAVDKC